MCRCPEGAQVMVTVHAQPQSKLLAHCPVACYENRGTAEGFVRSAQRICLLRSKPQAQLGGAGASRPELPAWLPHVSAGL